MEATDENNEDAKSIGQMSQQNAMDQLTAWLCGSDRRRRQLAREFLGVIGAPGLPYLFRHIMNYRHSPAMQRRLMGVIERMDAPATPETLIALEIMSRVMAPNVQQRATLMAKKLKQGFAASSRSYTATGAARVELLTVRQG